MKKFLFGVLAMVWAICAAADTLTLISADDSTAVAGATVISSNGLILGITDDNGSIAVASRKDFPLNVRSMGFESAVIPEFVDTVALRSAVYRLPEVEVNIAERPVTKVVCYVREYCTGSTPTDTMQLYCEYMMTGYYAPDKVKGYKSSDRKLRIRNERQFAGLKNVSGLDSVFIPDKNDEIMLLAFAELSSSFPYGNINESQRIKDGFASDTIPGEYSPYGILRKNKNIYSVETDGLSKYKDHRWSPNFAKLLGATMDFDVYKRTRYYNVNTNATYGPYDFISAATTIRILGRGKLIKKVFRSKEPVEMFSYQELYPVEIEKLTVQEYKDDRSSKAELPFRYPADIPALSPSIQRLVGSLTHSGF